MTQTIEQLWNGSLAPCEKSGAGDSQIKELFSRMRRNREDLMKEITLEQKDIFQKYVDCWEAYECLVTERAFCDGFCVASKLLAEALCQGSR